MNNRLKVEDLDKVHCNNCHGICTQATWIHVTKVKIYIQYVNANMDDYVSFQMLVFTF